MHTILITLWVVRSTLFLSQCYLCQLWKYLEMRKQFGIPAPFCIAYIIIGLQLPKMVTLPFNICTVLDIIQITFLSCRAPISQHQVSFTEIHHLVLNLRCGWSKVPVFQVDSACGSEQCLCSSQDQHIEPIVLVNGVMIFSVVLEQQKSDENINADVINNIHYDLKE